MEYANVAAKEREKKRTDSRYYWCVFTRSTCCSVAEVERRSIPRRGRNLPTLRNGRLAANGTDAAISSRPRRIVRYGVSPFKPLGRRGKLRIVRASYSTVRRKSVIRSHNCPMIHVRPYVMGTRLGRTKMRENDAAYAVTVQNENRKKRGAFA